MLRASSKSSGSMLLTFSSRLQMESKVSLEPKRMALFLPFSFSSSSFWCALFSSSCRSKSSSPILSYGAMKMLRQVKVKSQSSKNVKERSIATSRSFLASCIRLRQYLIQHLAISARFCRSSSRFSHSASPLRTFKITYCNLSYKFKPTCINFNKCAIRQKESRKILYLGTSGF